MLKSILAVVVGFILVGVLALAADFAVHAAAPDAYDAKGRTENLAVLLLALLYTPVFGAVGGYVTARLAPGNPQRHALALGILGLVFSVPVVMAHWNDAPAWYHIVSLLTVVPAAWLGGSWRARQTQVTGA